MTADDPGLSVAVAPEGVRAFLGDAVQAGGGSVVGVEEAEAVVWADPDDAAGLSKLLGPAWWNGTALWNVLANFEFAPMQFALYNWLLRFLGRHQLLFECVLTFGTYFTLWFEIMYAVWIWRPSTRWLILSAAILLHGVIGIFMGLGTFALIMLVMNMAFLRDEEVAWLLGQFGIDLQIARLPKLAA